MSPDVQQHINVAQFEELRDLLEEDFNDLIQTYINDSEIRLTELDNAYHNNDNRLGFEAAHSLKGASSNLGATTLSELCYQLQEVCRNNQIQEHRELVDEVIAECRAVNTHTKQLLAQ